MRARVADYDLVAPEDLTAALRLVAEAPGVWTPIAGGTDLMVQLSHGRLPSRRLMSIWRLAELSQTSADPQALRIGAACTFSDLRRNLIVCHEFPALALAAGWTGSVANQNRATIGGNIVNASPAADSPPALLMYDAELELASTRGTRQAPYSAFHTGYKQTLLAPDELLTAVILPRRTRSGLHYLRKVGARRAQAISKIGLGAYGELRDGAVSEVRIAVASAGPTPLRGFEAEACLFGRPLTDETIRDATEALGREIRPIDDIRSTLAYRRQVAMNLLREFLGKLKGHAA